MKHGTKAGKQEGETRRTQPVPLDVLVMDDDEDLREILGIVVEELTGRQGSALTAADNVTGLELLLGAKRPLVVLLDRFMGPLRFEQLVELLATSTGTFGERLRRHRYVVLTASPKTIDKRERALLKRELNGAPIVAKPFELEHLERVIGEARKWLAERELERTPEVYKRPATMIAAATRSPATPAMRPSGRCQSPEGEARPIHSRMPQKMAAG